MEDLKSKLEDLEERAFRTARPCVSEFLPVARAEELGLRGEYLWLGGRENAERARFCALPYAGFAVREEDFLAAVCIRPNDGGSYGHRDYLGSLLALGISREGTGDLVVRAGEAYVLLTPQLADFVCEHLRTVSRTGCKCRKVSLSEIPAPERKAETLACSVSSLRLDCVLSAAFGVSRADAKTLCERGACTVNRKTCEKPEKSLAEGDFVTLRGYGRFRVEGETGRSKKGKIRLSLSKEG